jgi:hypothetical protein
MREELMKINMDNTNKLSNFREDLVSLLINRNVLNYNRGSSDVLENIVKTIDLLPNSSYVGPGVSDERLEYEG